MAGIGALASLFGVRSRPLAIRAARTSAARSAGRVAERLVAAFRRARVPLLASAAVYVTFLVLGIASVSSGWTFAVNERDSIVGGAQTSPITQADRSGDRLGAALLDFGSNVALGAIPTSITGLTLVGPFPIAAYRGWIGGIVSIDGGHRSRLMNLSSAAYYIIVVILQLAGYVLTMAAGVHLGWNAWKLRNDSSIRSFFGLRIPSYALADAAALYLVALPAFLAGSLYEFLA